MVIVLGAWEEKKQKWRHLLLILCQGLTKGENSYTRTGEVPDWCIPQML